MNRNKEKEHENTIINDEEDKIINETEIYYSKKFKKDYISLNIKKSHLECIFFFIFVLLILFLIVSGVFQKKEQTKESHISLANINYKNYINVAYAFDSKYEYITHVSMKSIMLSQNYDTYIIFHILVSSNIKDKEKEVIDKICIQHNNCKINYYQMGERFKGINTVGFITWSTAMYYRLRLPDLLPNEKRVLYLDCDTLIYKDLTKIYNYDISDNYFTGMLEPRDLSYLKLNVKNYINTGVMLFNLEELRKDDIPKKIEEFLVEHNFKLLFPVNDAVNTVCHEKNGYFPPHFVQWGFCNVHLIDKYINDLQIKVNKEDVLKAYKDPYIYHLIGYKNKPWNGIPNYYGTVCIDPIVRFYELAKKTDYYYEIIEQFTIYREYLINK